MSNETTYLKGSAVFAVMQIAIAKQVYMMKPFILKKYGVDQKLNELLLFSIINFFCII